jgi:hypothetical protein
MADPTQPQLPTEEIDEIAAQLSRRGLAAPAAILLDAHRPLLPALRQAALFLGPFAGPLLGRRVAAGLEAVSDDEAAYDRLAGRLSEPRRR